MQHWPYLFPALGVLALVAFLEMVPRLVLNEWVYLLTPRGIADPGFLPDSLGTGRPVFTAFWVLGAGLFLALRDPLWVAMVGRILGWTLVVYSLTRLCQELGIGGWSFFFAVSLWLLTGQSLMAGEWIFGGVEQKVFAYGFLILALSGLLRGQGFQAGLFSGLAIAFHILVGGWGAMALGVAAVASMRRLGRRTVIMFFGTAFVCGLPFFLLAVRSVFAPGGAGPPAPADFDSSAFYVLFRNPHHLDPAVFLTPKKFVKLLVLGGCVLLLAGAVRKPGRERTLLAFLAVVFGLFCCGLVARKVGFFAFLSLYPFRLGDVLVPLFFWLLGFGLLVETARGIVRYRPSGVLPPVPALVLFALVLVPAGEMGRDVLPNLRTRGRAALDEWLNSPSAEEDAFDEMSRWIRVNTNPESVFAVPPCQHDFLMRAERPAVLTFKRGPRGHGSFDWFQRLKALNGGRGFSGVGFDICSEAEENFNHLSPGALRDIARNYSAEYYLATRGRPDLPSPPAFHAGSYYLFDLERFNEVGSPPS